MPNIKIQGMLHIKVLRSPHHHGRLHGLDISRAAQMPGVKRIITWADVPHINGFPAYSIEEPVLTPIGETLRMKGAPIALIVAENADQAEAARDATVIDIEPLPYTFDMEEALRPGALHIAGNANELSRFQVQHGDLESFRASDHIRCCRDSLLSM
jgi:CO/xanthine dehydrogenase Mo-binding subunit